MPPTEHEMTAGHDPAHGPGATGRGAGLKLLVALLLAGAVLAITLARYRGPAPRDAEAPAAEFSAARAQEYLAAVVGDGASRAVGTAGNAAARQRILDLLAGMGYEPQVQTTTACGGWGACAEVRNILARREGQGDGPAVLLAAHYDSVAAGPGVADDASGVAAILEIARILAAGPVADNPVILLFTDAEEGGLIGARGFVDEHPWASQVGAVINLEARGVRGPSLMFETSTDNAWLLGHYAAAVERPVTSSVFYTIYQTLPNDTDFTVFRGAGMAGYNLSFIEGVEHYHRPSDDLEELDASTLQHHGDNALALTRRLAASDLVSPAGGGAVFFDLLTFAVVQWPQGLTLPLALLTLVLMVVALVLILKRRRMSGGALVRGLLGWLLMVVVALVAAFGLRLLLGALGALPGPRTYPWVARPAPLVIAFWAMALAAVTALAAWWGRRAGSWGTWSGVWLWWSLAALALAVTLPGVSYLFLVPALLAALVGVVAALGGSPGWRLAAVLVPLVAAAVLWFFLAVALYEGIGAPGLIVVGVLVALFATTLAPLVADLHGGARWLLPAAAAVVAVVAVGLAAAGPLYDGEVQRPLNVIYFEDAAAGSARWLTWGRSPGAVPAETRQAGDFGDELVTGFPWMEEAFYLSAAAPASGLAPPEVVFTSDQPAAAGGRRLEGRLVSPRGARVARLHWSAQAAIRAVRFAGHEVWAADEGEEPDSGELSFLALPADGIELELVTGATEAVEIWVTDESSGLPAAGQALIDSRPAAYGTIGDGDRTVVGRPVRLEATAAEEQPEQEKELAAAA